MGSKGHAEMPDSFTILGLGSSLLFFENVNLSRLGYKCILYKIN